MPGVESESKSEAGRQASGQKSKQASEEALFPLPSLFPAGHSATPDSVLLEAGSYNPTGCMNFAFALSLPTTSCTASSCKRTAHVEPADDAATGTLFPSASLRLPG